jgi:hypothetical protein
MGISVYLLSRFLYFGLVVEETDVLGSDVQVPSSENRHRDTHRDPSVRRSKFSRALFEPNYSRLQRLNAPVRPATQERVLKMISDHPEPWRDLDRVVSL